MIVARVIQGVGGGMLPLAFGIVRDEFPQEKVTGAIGNARGADRGRRRRWGLSWRADHHSLELALAVLASDDPDRDRDGRRGAVRPGVADPHARPDQLAALLLSAWLVALLVALSEAPEWGWGSGKVIGLIIAAVVLAVRLGTRPSSGRPRR